MNNPSLNNFLVKAKRNTYASSGEGGEKVFSDGAKELYFEEGGLKYRDRYFGFNPFVGEEIVWEDGVMVWGMNYYGKILSDTVDVKALYTFLQDALKLVPQDRPFRGPEKFSQGDFSYTNLADGTVEQFYGKETIFYKQEKVYELIYHGGPIAEKEI